MDDDDLVWCNTCGKDITIEKHLANDGDCDVCHQWWIDNALD